MARFIRVVMLASLVCALTTSAARAQNASILTPEEGRDESLYHRPPAYQPNSRALIHQKAEATAAQRRARLASLNWYGMSNARPTASPTPFASRYSPVWEMPGHRPYAWHPVHRPGHFFYTR